MANIKHIAVLTSVRTTIAQPNERKPDKPHGHRIAEVVFTNENGDREYTYVDPTAENSALWEALLAAYHRHKPCHIGVEFPAGVRMKNRKTGLINADINGVAPVITNIFDPDTGLSKLPKADPRTDLFEITK
jgi:hypothetical protein